MIFFHEYYLSADELRILGYNEIDKVGNGAHLVGFGPTMLTKSYIYIYIIYCMSRK